MSAPGEQGPSSTVAALLLDGLGERWEQGWEPLDVAHVARQHGDARCARLTVALIDADAGRHRRRLFAPERWLAQYHALGLVSGSSDPSGPTDRSEPDARWFERWCRAERVGGPEALEQALRLLALLRGLPALLALDLAPSAWTERAADHRRTGPDPTVSASITAADPKLLATIRALLAKAESTPFPAEAEAFSTKAQELMSRHAIDAALLAAHGARDGMAGQLHRDVQWRRLPIDQPYGAEKAHLLAIVGDTNNLSVQWDDDLALATVVGFPADLDVAELLFTSLLVQATRALADGANATPERRAPTFRRAFLLAYAERIGDRLRERHQAVADQAVASHGAELVPVMVARREAVEAVAEELFGPAAPTRGRMVDAEGWEAGRAAAERAELGGGRPEVERAGAERKRDRS